MTRVHGISSVVLIVFALHVHAAESSIPLAGEWRFALDRDDAGIKGEWFNKDLAERLKLPGSLQEQGFGDAPTVETKWTGDIIDKSWFKDDKYAPFRQPGNVKVPFWLQPTKHYVGAAWFQRDVEIPADWKGRRIVLHLERPHWETTVWGDAQRIGSQNSLAVPHEYDLSAALTPGKHRLTIRVDNRMVVEVGVNSHSVSDHTQGNWNGIVGDLKLTATDPVWIDDVQVFPDLARRCLTVRADLGKLPQASIGNRVTLRCRMEPRGGGKAEEFGVLIDGKFDQPVNRIEQEFPLPADVKLWDEFSPSLYDLTVAIPANHMTIERRVTFGLREAKRHGTQIALNGRKLFLRGTLECCIFPLHGYPPTDVASWKKVLTAARAHGLNHLRFHSYCPPEAAFQAADEMGFYYYVECPSWANQGSTIGDGRPVDKWLYEEGDRILRAHGNHPSFIMMSYGNEPAGKNQNRWLGDLIKHWKSLDQRRLYTSGAGWPMIPENDFHVTPTPRVQGWGQGLASRINAKPPETMTDYRDYIQKAGAPVVSHEIGQWCVYPNFDEMAKYTGWLKPKNFEVFRETLKANGMLDQAHDFLIASGKLQTLCYKEDIESALRTPGMAGFELLDLHDFPGQGTALVGVLDPFWGSKGYVTPEEYSRFCNSTVPLARMEKRILQNNESFTAHVEIAHFGPRDLDAATAVCSIRDATGKLVSGANLPADKIPTGAVTRLGLIGMPLAQFTKAEKLNLEIAIHGTPFVNDWDLWVYPAQPAAAPPPAVHVAQDLDDAALAALKNGGRVLLLVPPQRVRGDALGRVKIGFSSIFWNTAWTNRQPPHTLGILCDPKHPALADFPTEIHSNWQWWELVSRSHPFILTDAPAELRPVVQVVDDWVTARKLGLVFEVQVGGGKLLACAIDLANDLASRPVARELRRSLMEYMASDRFAPSVKVEPAYVRSLLTEPSAMHKLGARIISSSRSAEDYEPQNAIDDDPNTIWHTAWGDDAPKFPHEIVVGFAREVTIKSVGLLPRQDKNRNGWIKEYALYISPDGQAWGEPAARGVLEGNADLKEIRLTTPAHGRFLKLVAVSGFDKQPFASLAELTVQPGDP